MVFDLEHARLDFSIGEDVEDRLGVEIRDANVLYEAFGVKVLQGFPSLADRNLLKLDFFFTVVIPSLSSNNS